LCADTARPPFSSDRISTLTGTVILDERGRPKQIWVFPFASANDAVCLNLVSEEQATIDYYRQKPASGAEPNRPTRLIFIDDCWPERLSGELKSLERSGTYDFYICPAKPLEHTTTITVYGFGAWSNYRAKVSNPGSLPYIHRSRLKLLANSLNYLWAVPLDAVIMPVFYPAWTCWMKSGLF
jgi:hypothetical protein